MITGQVPNRVLLYQHFGSCALMLSICFISIAGGLQGQLAKSSIHA